MSRRTVLISAGVLFCLYVLFSFGNNTRGFLGTDTGGKVATLRAMDAHGTTDPDVGYWAERWDPDGSLHPLYYTSHIGSRWVNVTTLPAVYAALPLYRAFGYRGALVVPMLGAVACALAAAALARRLGARDGGRLAFWLVGLASPVTIYALDFWEHTVGLALMAWGVVVLVDLAQRKKVAWFGVAAGLLFGGAATMRTEALAFGAVATAVVCVGLARRNLPLAVAVGALVAIGTSVPLFANDALERSVLGTSLRAGRAQGTVAIVGSVIGDSRVKEAAITSVGINGEGDARSLFIGAAVVAAIVAATLRRDWRLLALAGALYAARGAQGLGFVPGFLMAAPIGLVGLTLGWRRGPPAALTLLIGFVALPLVWAVQFTGGAGPQWGGRYVLLSGFVLAVVGVVVLADLPAVLRQCMIGLAVGVTVFGGVWMHQRTHDIAVSAARLEALPEPILVSRIAHLVREGGAVHDLRRWLTAPSSRDLEDVARIADATHADRIAVVGLDGQAQPARIGSLVRQPSFTRLRLLHGVAIQVWVYAR